MHALRTHLDENGHSPELGRPAEPACRVAIATLFVSCLVLGSQFVLAQTGLYKCTDGNSITYSSSTCEKIGLKPGGEVRDRLTVIPGGQPAAKSAPTQQKADTDDEEQRARKAAATVQPVNPLIQKLLK